MTKNKLFPAVLGLSLTAVLAFAPQISSAAPKCKYSYRTTDSKAVGKDLPSIAEIVAKGESPFDVARFNRKQDPEASDALLDEVTSRLQNEKVVKIESLGGGVNLSLKITFESGLIAAYKPVNPDRANQPIREAVAYRLSRLMGLDIVPPTVVRKLSGDIVPPEYKKNIGSIQLFVVTAKPLKKGQNSDGKILLNGDKVYDPENSVSGRRLRIFDWLINNHDRGSNAGNYLISKEDDYLIGIDHSVAFVGHDKQARSDKVPYYKPEFLTDVEMYQMLTAPSVDAITSQLDGLNPTRIEEFFQRYDQLIADFKKALKIKK